MAFSFNEFVKTNPGLVGMIGQLGGSLAPQNKFVQGLSGFAGQLGQQQQLDLKRAEEARQIGSLLGGGGAQTSAAATPTSPAIGSMTPDQRALPQMDFSSLGPLTQRGEPGVTSFTLGAGQGGMPEFNMVGNLGGSFFDPFQGQGLAQMDTQQNNQLSNLEGILQALQNLSSIFG